MQGRSSLRILALNERGGVKAEQIYTVVIRVFDTPQHPPAGILPLFPPCRAQAPRFLRPRFAPRSRVTEVSAI